MSAIEDKYNALLAQGWTPAVPLSVIPAPVPGTPGHFFGYVLSNGVAVTLYNHPAVGTFEVHGAILARYLELGGPLAYGFPITDEIDDVVGYQAAGRVSHFERGSVFYSHGRVFELTASAPSGADFEIYDGIDVSYAQGRINWTKVGQAGLGFAYMKATEGDNLTDAEFARNWSGSDGALRRGAYHYFHARTTPDAARAQADHFVDVVAAAAGSAADLPPMVDVESLPQGVTAAQAITSLEFFLAIVWQATGQRPLIYTYPSFWQSALKGSSAFVSTYQLWIASYGRPLGGGEYATRPNGPLVSTSWSDYAVWQHAVRRGVPGIGTAVDRDMVMVPGGLTLAEYLG
ncbi:GH25 family lysozyme [Streptomyces albogriseolus]|uniref:GH25 family lysozyme n=1 Tax=Streptomyces albogriseolus TaxID=1887 RepID=UPI0034603223